MSTSGSFTPAADDPCPTQPMTRDQVVALRDSGQLRVDCHYVVSDFVQGTTLPGPNLVELHAVSPNALSMEAKVFTPYDNVAWLGVYDIDRGTVGVMIELRDNLNNTVRDTTTGAIVGVFPWGTAGWSENYLDSVTLTAPATARAVTGNTITNSTVDMTGWTTGAFTTSRIEGSTVTTGGNMSLTRAIVTGLSTLTGAATGSITVSNGVVEGNSSVINDVGSAKTWSLTGSVLQAGCVLRGQGAAAVAGTITQSTLSSRGGTNALVLLGSSALTVSRSVIEFGSGLVWSLDGAAGITVSVTDADMRACNVTRSATAGRFDFTSGRAVGTTFDHQGTGIMGVNSSHCTTGSLVRLATGSTGDVSVVNSTLAGGSVIVTAVRSLSLLAASVVESAATVTESGTTPTTVPSIGDRLDGTHVEPGAQVTFATTAGSGGNTLARSRVRGSSVVGHGVVRIDGTTDGAFMDACEILGGILTVTDAVAGLSGATALHDLHLDAGSTLTYTTGDATAKQLRNIRIEGQSTLTLTGITGGAGGGLGDVFGISLRGQSLMTVAGARVVGQPIRNVTVEQGATLNIPAGGCVQRCRVAGGATLNTGAFVHFDTEVSLAAVTTLTAANVNRLRDKSYSDVV
ncbi:hypothetical protein [Streptomyces sp. H27-H5]|uniref:hypothetical protein n=1 Tax=Streptomyces sp. H27-H5 TaxID=2996460 RepID=UPI002271DF08|nr:hypothetical protein [Streptomyces sp. H27-H5]MCY0957740.1 hypothetical protein [Streptomyces sp. H27-H5]